MFSPKTGFVASASFAATHTFPNFENMGRQKPFSGKKKREQLSLKRHPAKALPDTASESESMVNSVKLPNATEATKCDLHLGLNFLSFSKVGDRVFERNRRRC